MLRKNGHILVSDFGCAKILDEAANSNENDTKEDEVEQEQLPEERKRRRQRRCSFVGTAQYVSPEVWTFYNSGVMKF